VPVAPFLRALSARGLVAQRRVVRSRP
jgi:hypothetical protein